MAELAGCPKEISIGCWEHPPFVIHDSMLASEVSHAEGVIWSNAMDALAFCCGASVQQSNPEPRCTTWYNNEREALEAGFANHHVIIPATQLSMHHSSFVGVTSSPGTVLLYSEERPESVSHWTILFEAWPLLVIILLSSGFAGIIMWMLDRSKNSSQFHKSFFIGFLEGYWWAFVTMTTVGYGDRTPKSVLGRLFAIVWIIFGVCTVSIFTATITTAFSEGRNGWRVGKMQLNTQLVTINGSYERLKSLEMAANIRVVSTPDKLLKAAETLAMESGSGFQTNSPFKKVAAATSEAITKQTKYRKPESEKEEEQTNWGVMMEHLMWLHFRKKHAHMFSHLEVISERALQTTTQRGFLTNLSLPVRQCAIQWMENREFFIAEETLELTHDEHFPIPVDDLAAESAKRARSLFAITDVFGALVAGTILLLVTLSFGVWELFYFRPRNKLDEANAASKPNPSTEEDTEQLNSASRQWNGIRPGSVLSNSTATNQCPVCLSSFVTPNQMTETNQSKPVETQVSINNNSTTYNCVAPPGFIQETVIDF